MDMDMRIFAFLWMDGWVREWEGGRVDAGLGAVHGGKVV